MDNDPSQMDFETTTPTASQEAKLLEEPGISKNPDLEGKATPAEVQKTTAQVKTAEKEISKPFSANTNSEITVSIKTGSVIPNANDRNRTRPKTKRNAARMHSVNPHERVKDILSNDLTPTKRGRESGGTPPSANQPNKKGTAVVPPASSSNKQSTGSTKKRNKKKKKTNALNSSLQQNADPKARTESKVPPSASQPTLFGSENQTEASNQPIASTSKDAAANDQVMQVDDTYASVAKHLCLAVIDQRKQGQMILMDQTRFDMLSSVITDTMLSQADNNTNLPEIEDTRLHSGAMRIRCTNIATRQWMEQNIPTLDKKKLWNGATLVVMDFKDLPKPHKFNVWFRGIKKSSKDIFKLLESQNKGITTKSWTVLHSQVKDNGTAMTIGVGQDSFDLLRERSNSLFCGMGKANFTIVKGCKENQALLHQRVATASSTTNDGEKQTTDPNMAVDAERPPQEGA